MLRRRRLARKKLFLCGPGAGQVKRVRLRAGPGSEKLEIAKWYEVFFLRFRRIFPKRTCLLQAGNYKICLLNIALARKHNYKARSEPKLADGRTSSADGEASQSEEPTPAASGLEQAGERGDLRWSFDDSRTSASPGWWSS